eukprot:SAG31_NODE_3037_length_4761_cov_2.884384_5_plen_73_part_00
MTGYMQLAHLDFALGGTIVMDGFPLPPLQDMPGHPLRARANATYYGHDMRWCGCRMLILHDRSLTLIVLNIG